MQEKVSSVVFFVILSVVFFLAAGDSAFGESQRERLLMDFGWEFNLGHLCDVEKDFGYQENRSKTSRPDGPCNPEFDANAWPSVDLPHDWAVGLTVDSGADAMHAYKPLGRKYPENSVGWYRKSFEISESDLGKRLSLVFDGVFRNCEVWLNGYSLYRHLSGYTSFEIDITDYVNYGGRNVVVVRVDASGYELWSYEGAGIYRHVWLAKASPVHVVQWGTFVMSEVDGDSAVVTIETKIANESDEGTNIKLRSTVVDAEGQEVVKVESGRWMKGWSEAEIKRKVKVNDVHLWSLKEPYLYKLVTEVEKQGQVVDRCETIFGIRSFRFDPDAGFFLNGEPIKLKGVCLHQDHGGVGIAVPDVLHDFRIKKMKEMGANAFRCAHNPVAPEALDAADRLGMLVIDETRAPGSTDERLEQLRSIIRRDRNHPSVILWSLANEEGSLEKGERGVRVISSMKRLVRELDPSRPVTMAIAKGQDGEAAKDLDVVGCNYIRKELEGLHEKYPSRPWVLTESCCHSTARGVYENDAAGRFSNYDENPACWGNPAEKMWRWCVEHRWMAGTFIWTGFDYAGEPLAWMDDCKSLPSEEIWPILHTQWGIVDRCGFEKDPFYYFKSWWTDEVVVHVFPHWNWAGKEGKEIRVCCYSNCEEVELIVNGKSLGKTKMERNSHLEWKVEYEPGYIEVKGYNGGKVVATSRRETTGESVAIKLEPDRMEIKADNHDISQVTLRIVDGNGRMVPTANNEVELSVNGGRIIGVCNGDPADHVPENQTTHPVFNGLLMVYVQSSFEAGPIVLKAKAEGLKGAEVTIESQSCKVRPYVSLLTRQEE